MGNSPTRSCEPLHFIRSSVTQTFAALDKAHAGSLFAPPKETVDAGVYDQGQSSKCNLARLSERSRIEQGLEEVFDKAAL